MLMYNKMTTEHFKKSIYALKTQPFPIISFSKNHNIQSKLFIQFIANIVSNKSDFIAIVDYEYKKKRTSDFVLLDGFVNNILEHLNNISPKHYQNQLKDLESIITQPFFNNNNQYISIYGFKTISNKSSFNVNDNINVKITPSKIERFKILQKISVKNKFNILYDVYYKNGVKYITTFELTDILLLNPQNTTKHIVLPYKTEPLHKQTYNKLVKSWSKYYDDADDEILDDLMGYDHQLLFFDDCYGVNIFEALIEALLKQLYQEKDKTEYYDTKDILKEAKEWLFTKKSSNDCISYKPKRYAKILRFFLRARENMFFSGLYNITTKPFYNTKSNNKKIKRNHSFIFNDGKYIDNTEELLSYSHKEIEIHKNYEYVNNIDNETEWNEARSSFVFLEPHYSFETKKIINDDELLLLFNDKKLKKKKKKKKSQDSKSQDSNSQDSKSQDSKSQDSNSQDSNSQEEEIQSNTYFYRVEIDKNIKDKIEYLLNELFSYNTYFGNMLIKNNNTIHIIKDIHKHYTQTKYINFSFDKNNKQYHAYLNTTETAITNITFIESIQV